MTFLQLQLGLLAAGDVGERLDPPPGTRSQGPAAIPQPPLAALAAGGDPTLAVREMIPSDVAGEDRVDEILRLTGRSPIVSERIERRPLWLEWKYLWLVFGCLQVEWIVRKWKGLS